MAVILGAAMAGLPVAAGAEDLSSYPRAAQLPAGFSQGPMNPSIPAVESPVNQLAERYTTPKAIASFLKHEFVFRRDEAFFGEEDRWQAPEEFVARRIGDCEDYALLAKALLQRNGYEADVLSLFGEEGYAHTIAVYRDEDGRYNVINQAALKTYRAKSLEAALSAVNPSWTIAMVAEQDGPRGRSVRQISNPHPAPGMDEFPTF
jgi:predicted transglutaminase-like cysteine proteinase